METRRGSLGTGVVTPADRLFIRNNLPLPERFRVRDYTLEVTGVVDARSVGIRELRSLGLSTVAAVLQCSGNGRKYFGHQASGSQWGSGAAGCVIWTGVRVRDVVDALGGVTEGARFLTATGGETLPEDVDRDSVVVERSIPIGKAMEDCLLAWEMNGEPIPHLHGGPLRLVVPGYYGCNNIKWLKRIALTTEQSSARMMRTSYRVRPIGESGAPEQESMWEMNVKSFMVQPTEIDSLKEGLNQIVGVAFSGGSPIVRVDVSVDGGVTWERAELVGPDLGRYAWRLFRFAWRAEVGEHTVFTRATDASGAVQPETRADNERGYGNNAWRDHGVVLTVCEEDGCNERRPEPSPAFADVIGGARASDLSEEALIGRRVFMQIAQPSCTSCHTLREAGATAVVGPDLDRLQPDRERVIGAVTHGVGVMPAMGGTLSEAEIRALAQYLLEATGG